MQARVILFVLIVSFCSFPVIAQTIRGEVLDMDDKKPVTGVSIENIHTSLNISTSEQGAFLIAAASGQLLEFKKSGYKTVRVRVPKGYVPPYFRIIMTKGISEIPDMGTAQKNRYDYASDSIRYHELYKHELDFPKLSSFDMIAHPFSALSAKNREVWRFQEEFDEFEKEKYVDKTFNESVVTKFTGLKGDSLHYYLKRYRPTYDQLKIMNDYTFYNFIKTTVHQYRNRNTPRNAQ